MNDVVDRVEAEPNFYSNVDQDRKSDGSHSDDEVEGHVVHAVRRESVEAVRANVIEEESIYDELQEHQSDSEGSDKGEHHGRGSDELYDDTRVGHARENGHQRRGSHDSDEVMHELCVSS